MKISKEAWLYPKSIKEAKAAQEEMAKKVVLEDGFQTISYIAGVDISNNPFDPNQMIYASVVVMSFPSFEIVEIGTASLKQEFPYISGLLGFREVPALLKAFESLTILPDLIMVDGHGISHPRGLGIASHLGVLLDLPTIGVAKSILVGDKPENLSNVAGSTQPLMWKEKEIGTILKSKKNCLPLFISPGHKISFQSSLKWVNASFKGYRLPEPTRHAHLQANAFRVK